MSEGSYRVINDIQCESIYTTLALTSIKHDRVFDYTGCSYVNVYTL